MSNLLLDSTPILEVAHLVSGQLSPECVEKEHWSEIVKMALDHGVGGMLLWSLRQAGWVCSSEGIWKPLVDSVRRNGRHNLLIEKVRRLSANAFDQADIPAIWLKGIALAHKYYPEPHLRPMVDLDVLVHANQLESAREVLHTLGFHPAEIDFFELGNFTHQARHHECLLDQSRRVRLDLHFRLLVPALLTQMDEGYMEWFWTQTEDLALDGASFLSFKPEANLLYLCAHSILQNQGEPLDLLHLLDLHLLITQSSLDWDLMVKQAAFLRWTYAVEYALNTLPALFGTQLPAGVFLALQKNRQYDEHHLSSTDSLNSTRRWDDWRSAFRRMNNFQRLRLVWLTLFPPGVFLRQQYHLSPNQVLLPYYISHLLDGGREAVRALMGINKATKRTQ